MTTIQLRYTFSRDELPESSEPQMLYLLLEATPQGGTTTSAKLPLNLSLVIDRSSSMRGDRLMQVKEAAKRIIDQMSNKDYFALVTFNDHGEVVIPSQRVTDKNEIKHKITGIEAAGGTEMATGLGLALQEHQRTAIARGISRMLILTDGRTYGDESRCVQIARRAQERQIGITALGIGNEWNEDLLETIAASENSRTHYITSAQEITQVFADELERMHTTFAQNVQMHVKVRKGGVLRALDRLQPFIAPIQIIEEKDEYWVGKLGDWPSSDIQMFLLELMVPPLGIGEHPLLQLMLRYDLPSSPSRPQPVQSMLNMVVRPAADVEDQQANSIVRHWLERLVAYRLQARAWNEAEQGNIKSASTRLEMASTRLFEAGETDLARTLQREATQLLRSGQTSTVGRKQIKYGTRGLMGKEPPR